MKRIAVALRDVEPATFECCALTRDWLDDHGIDRVTLFVVPAPEPHPLAGVEPHGFVAPGYAYTRPLRAALRSTFDWWVTLAGVQRRASPTLRAPLLWPRIGLLAAPLLRLDVDPCDLERPKQIWAFEQLLRRAHGREAVTYDDVAGAL